MDDGAKAGREPKHLVLDNAISGINGAVDHIDSILIKIKGSSPEPELVNSAAPVDRSPYFIDVLESGPDRIRKYCSEISEKLNELENLLF